LKLAPELVQLSGARRFISKIACDARFSDSRVFDIMVACSEGMANAVEHAAGGGAITIEARTYPDRLEVSVHGTGDFEMPDRSSDREHRGLGLPLMAKLSDQMALYSGPQGGTLLTLTFYRDGQAHSGPVRL
jgi:anti-sigma regulatory factor (Ser/Thr protein kinase)